MKINELIISSLFILLTFLSCEKDKNIDTEHPAIDIGSIGGFPNNCDTIYFGESFDFKVLFSDNKELGSIRAFSIDIHNNFNHHSHSTEVTACYRDPKKEPVNPYSFVEIYDIPAGLIEYETALKLSIPSGNDDGAFDDGDYHFFIRLSDNEGWSAQKGLAIKMIHR